MGLFKRKPSPIGTVAREVRVHYRKLRNVPLPNIPPVAHWALQVGEYTYEVAAPPAAIFTQQIALWLNQEIKQRLADGDDDFSEDELLDSLPLDDLDDTALTFEGGSPFTKNPKDVFTAPGKNKWRVPLQIGPTASWSSSKFNKNSHSIPLGTTHLTPSATWQVTHRLFKEVFERGYDMLYNNCHAFVCHLWSAIQLLDPPRIKFNQHAFPSGGPPFTNRHFYLSFVGYVTWKHVAGEPIPPDPTARWRDWNMKEKWIEYGKLIPPRRMKELIEPDEQLPRRPVRERGKKGVGEKGHGPKSHAGHAGSTAQHERGHNRDIVLQNATVAQQQAVQLPGQGVPGTGTMPDPSTGWGAGLGNMGIPTGVY